MEDRRFFTPMINCNNIGHIFVNDFVKVSSGVTCKVKTFFKEVYSSASSLFDALLVFSLGWEG